jgi:quercetin dioxygenase-like cupin family protein
MTATLHSWDGIPEEQVSAALHRRLICGERVMLAQVRLKAGGTVPRHEHVHEQFTYVVSGALHFRLGEDAQEEVTVRAGQVLHLPSHVWHEADVLEDSVVLDVFSPPREDWLAKTDSYLRVDANGAGG